MYKLVGMVFVVAITLTSCQQQEVKPTKTDDLSSLKNQFLQQISTNSEIEEGPFSFNYRFRTVFFSDDVISLVGELTVHDRLPHGWQLYEGKTLYKIKGRWQKITLDDLFQKKEQKEFLRITCENSLRNDPISHFSGEDPLYTTLKWDDINTFVIDDQYLIIIFQPYSVGGCSNGPIQVRIPFSDLDANWNTTHPFYNLFNQTIESTTYLSSWDEDEFYDQLADQ